MMDRLKVTRKILMEATRSQLINKSKKGDSYALSNQHKGKNRWERRKYSKIATQVRDFNSIDMNALFKGDMLEFTIPVQGETNNYKVVILFEKVLEEIAEQVKRNNNKLEYKCILRALLRVFNSDAVYVSCSCLHPDTKIKLLDGSTPTVEEMKERFDKGEKLYVYSADEKGDFKPGEVEKVWITKTTTNFVKITLDNGEIILTTPDHPYMLRDGSYKLAENLDVGQSLMPLYTSEVNGYETIKMNSEVRGWHTTYKEVADYFKVNEIQEAQLRSSEDDDMPYKVAIHHIDFNKSNNNPENLLPMTAREHWEYHANNMSIRWQQPEYREKMDKMFKSEAFSEAMKHRFDNETPEQRETRLAKVANSNKGKHFGKQSEATCKLKSERRRGISPGPMPEKTKKKISDSQKQHWENLSDEEKADLNQRRALTSEQYNNMVNAVREYHRNNPVTEEHRKHMSEARKGVPLGPNSEIAKQHKKEVALKNKDKTRQRVQDYWDTVNKEQKQSHIKNMCYARIKYVLQILIDNNIELTSENYYKYRPRYGSVRWENYFDTFNDVISYFNLNHKIVSIEHITLDETPVYDIKVKDWHNFAVAAGVYLHNCPDFTYSFQYWSTKNQYNSGTPQASNGKGIRNPNDTKGAACKHINLCLANLNWMMKIASVINNYIWYCKDNMEYNYGEYIFPKIYGMPYDKAIQLTLDNFDTNGNPITDPDLATDVATINLANAIGKRRTQFKKAPEKSVNPRYVPPKKEKPIPNKLGLNLDDEGTNESLIEKIVKIGDKWQVQSEEGRNLGTYDTREEAEKRLKQVEYFKNLDESLVATLKDKGFRFNENPVKGASYLLPDGSFLGMEENKDIIGSINGKTTHPDLDFWLLDNNLTDINSNEGNRALIKSDNAIRLNDGTNFADEAATISLPSDPLTSSQTAQLQNWLVETIYLTGAKRIDVGDETTDNFQSFDIDLDVEDNIEAIMSFIQAKYR